MPPDDDDVVLVAHEVFCNFGAVQALKPTSLSIARGQRVVLIGPSGCGKSTLLRVLIGLIVPGGGSVAFNGTPMTAANAERIRQTKMGYVIQSGGLFPHLTARQNATLLSAYLGMPSDEQDAKAQQLCRLVRLAPDVLDRYPQALSGGQRQRVALMRAMFTSPEILFLDEPLGAVDPMTRVELQAELVSIFDEVKTTVVMVTHDLAEAAYFADVIVLMKEGRIVQAGPLDALVHAPAEPFVREFLMAHRPFVPSALSEVQ